MNDGFQILRAVLEPDEQEELRVGLGVVNGAGRRGVLSVPAVSRLANSERMLGLARLHLCGEPRPVRVIYFDKSREANWLVAWHQDLTIAARKRMEVPEFGPWSVKDG